MDLGGLADALEGWADEISDSPLESIAWLPPQARTLRSERRFRLFRAGNQSLGKTTVGLAEVIFAARGVHPFRTPSKSAGEYWVVCAAWAQSIHIQKKLRALLPTSWQHPETRFDSLRGFRGKNPAVRVQHVDGSWSVIRFKTTNQGTLNLAGATVHGILFDEPPKSQELYGEIIKRVQSTGGWVLLTLTPIGAPLDWLRHECDRGIIEDIHARLTADQLIPEGADQPLILEDGTICDADWIARIEEETPEYEIPVRVHGEWELRAKGRVFGAWHQGLISDVLPLGVQILCLGLDHGTRAGKQVGILVAVVGSDEDEMMVHVLDEDVDEVGQSSTMDDAGRIVDMLTRNELTWSELDYAFGDRAHLKGRDDEKNNQELDYALARRLGIKVAHLKPRIKSAKKGTDRGRWSVERGVKWLHQRMVRGQFRVHPRCVKLIEALNVWNFSGVSGFTDDEHKDKIDALRYALDRYVLGDRPSIPGPTLRTR